MKLSLKFQGNDGDQHSTQTQIMTAKVPITVFNNYPFISGISATTTTANSSSDFSFSLSTNFPSGPTLRLSYSPTSSASLPFSLSLKSGLGMLGSPRHSPLVFSANFTLSPLPSFSLHLKPQFGHFSLNKTVSSDPNTLTPTPPSPLNSPHVVNGKGFVAVPDSSSSGWQNLKLEPFSERNHNNNNDVVSDRSLVGKNNAKCGLSPGVAVMARTVVPVTRGLFLNFRWGVNFPGNLGLKMPYLTVDKIGLERVEEVVVKQQDGERKHDTCSDADLQMLKGVCFSTRRDLEKVEEENREMKRVLGEIKMGVSNNLGGRSNENVGNGNKLPPQNSSESFERWGSNNRNGSGRQENEKKQPNKSQSVVGSDLESELQKAIKAASS